MDCPSEEHLIRSAMASVSSVARLDFDLPERSLTVWHDGDAETVLATLVKLELGAELIGSEQVANSAPMPDTERDQSTVLRLLLAINATMFAVELIAGWLGGSAGLLADSLDMLADAIVYGIALWAVGRTPAFQRNAARISGWFQLLLALSVLGEVARRVIQGGAPEAPVMMSTAALALLANVACVAVLARHRRGGVHMRASWIFSTNDVIANLGVILAGALVSWTSSAIPDLVIGAIICAVVLRGAMRIFKLARTPDGQDSDGSG